MVINLLKELNSKGIELTFTNGRLNYSGPEEHITTELLFRLKENKESLIRHFWPLKDSNLMPINPVGDKTPLILVHGEKSNYFLKEALGKDQPIYGFTHIGADGGKLPFSKVEDYVNFYIEQLLTILNSKKVILAGYSFGGILAHEIAGKLKTLGYEVPALFIIDTTPQLMYGNKFLQRTLTITKQKLKRLVWKIFPLLGLKVPVKYRRRRMFNEYFNLQYKHKLTSFFDEQGIILKASENNVCNSAFEDWKNHIKDVEIVNLKGTHFSMFYNDEGIKKMSNTIKKKLSEI